MDLTRQADRRRGSDRRKSSRTDAADRRANADRRRAERFVPHGVCPAYVLYDGHRRIAVVKNVSRVGLLLQSPEFGDVMKLKRGEKRVAEVQTADGPSCCNGCVAWATHRNEHCAWGLEFTRVSKDRRDPLTRMLDDAEGTAG
jgi:hypothetical protein